jgi:CRISPR-associated exonuclease Cas4
VTGSALDQEDDAVLLSALEHWSYCPRQCALIHLEQQFEDNVHTRRGHAVHARVDVPGYAITQGVREERGLPLYSERIGLRGKADVVEFLEDGTPYPVEYKHGPRRAHAHDELQLAAQALCLEEMTGRPVPKGAIYHASSRRRRELAIGPELRADVEGAVAAVRAMLRGEGMPAPVNDARCRHCSLHDLCQPSAVAATDRLRALRASLFEPE